MIQALSALSICAFLTIMLLSLGGQRFGWGHYWPPERPGSWQHRSFRLLFRTALYPLIAMSALLAREQGFWLPTLGFTLILLGFGAALLFTGKLGWRQAFGAATGLVTTGPYAYSRNPVYVATLLGLIGWAFCLPHLEILIPLTLWVILYVIAPFLEEPWLEAQFGTLFIEYKQKVRRFL